MELRDYQKEIASQGLEILQEWGIVILSMQVRTGKTLTALEIARRYGARKVLFVTKKKAIPSIEADWELLSPGFQIVVINYESLHKIPNRGFDLVVADESHSFGAFPKPSKRTRTMKEYVGGLPLVLLSGTLTPESYSQIYHQLWLSDNSPWRNYRSFYAWARDYVNVYEKYIAGQPRKFYDKAKKDLVMTDLRRYLISFTQKEAGFTSLVEEEVIELPMPENLRELYDEMSDDEVILRNTWAVAASNAADKINKLSQICGGTLKVDDDVTIELSRHKAEFIRDHFPQRKIAIFYKYIGERLILDDVFPDSTDVPEEFNDTDTRYFIGQIQSVREGVNLKSADCIVMYNIDFSATSYWQARARLQSKDREEPAKVYWLFYQEGIESYVYEAVQKKKNFTSAYYRSVRKMEMV